MKKILFCLALFGIVSSFPARSADGSTEPTAWTQGMEGLAPLGEKYSARLTDPNDPLLRQELYKFFYEMIAQGYFELLYQDPKYPDFWPMFNQAFPIFFANPDDSYYQTVVEDNGVYRISGFRGTARIVDFEIGSGLFVPYAKDVLGPTLKHYDLDHDVHLK